MIHQAMECIAKVADAYVKLKTQSPSSDRMVYLTNVTVGQEVAIPDKAIGLSLVNIEEERVFKDQQTRMINGKGDVEYRNPALKLNLYALFTANFTRGQQEDSEDYLEGLKQLSHVIELFQAKNVFTPENTPFLGPKVQPDTTQVSSKIEKLVVDLYSYSFEQMFNFWSVIGAPYLPSVLYRIRMLTIQQGGFNALSLPITEIGMKSKSI